MAVWYKQGVLGQLEPIAQKGKGRVAKLYAQRGLDLYITSQGEGNHMAGTFHEIGLAFDFRQLELQEDEILEALGPGWQLIFYDNGLAHAEYDPP